MTKSFADQVADIVDRNVKALRAVAQLSIQDVINDAQTPGPSVGNPGAGKGGRMPVVTGFLRQTGQSSLRSMPSGPTEGDKKEIGAYSSENTYSNTSGVNADLASLQVGGKFWFGWTAAYANKMNMRYGFLDAAIQNWQYFVNKNAEAVAKRMKTK